MSAKEINFEKFEQTLLISKYTEFSCCKRVRGDVCSTFVELQNETLTNMER
jgi:hypothetical protein